MEELLTTPPSQLKPDSSGSISGAPDDAYSQVMGAEHSGHVREVGFKPTSSNKTMTNKNLVGIQIQDDEERVRERQELHDVKNELVILKEKMRGYDTLKEQMAFMMQKMGQSSSHFPQVLNFNVV